ncbi:DeoR/GlpR transcriptional regulator [Cereibacter sphaeroides]|uniref:DeoR/GlpR family DNA-binding transcription regulator n=1 Tax=Cereibacter sphaeroides TaxID=1063 RepID=UPI000E5BC15B|nr:DeoR/GlpR family DNA-binding transcription regulator [Cereibacter sphaeroides]RHZ93203.1 DeoR/GlpR transcriptional regulator [Cereibacter sphaeroides]
MALNFRQTEILEIARSEGRVVVEQLAEHFAVTLQTIRRDLTELSDAGLLDRVHGGAVLRTGVSNIGYEERRRMNEAAKASIGRACARAIPNNSSMIINIGTTTEAVARELLNHRNITVVTNNMNVANILATNPSCEVMVAGGQLRRSDGGLVGDLTIQFIEQFKVDFAIIGASALDREGDMLDFDLAEVRVSKAILRQSRQRFLVTDSSKLDRKAPVRLGSLEELDAVFTDSPLPEELARRCESWETAVTVAEHQAAMPG